MDSHSSKEASVSSPPTGPSKLQIPLVFIGGAVLWILVTWVKWSILQKRHKRYARENEKLQNLLKLDSLSGKTVAEALKAFHERQAREEKAKFESCEGRTLVEEVDERAKKREEGKNGNKNPKPSTPPKYTREMFEDSGSRVYKEMMARRKREEEERDEIEANVAKEGVQMPKYSPEGFEDSAKRVYKEMAIQNAKKDAKRVKEGLKKEEADKHDVNHHHQGQSVKVKVNAKKGSVKLE